MPEFVIEVSQDGRQAGYVGPPEGGEQRASGNRLPRSERPSSRKREGAVKGPSEGRQKTVRQRQRPAMVRSLSPGQPLRREQAIKGCRVASAR